MMAQEAPPLSAQKTMMAQPAPVVADGSTKIIPTRPASSPTPPSGRARRAPRHHEALQAPPAGALFWLAWIMLGIGIGLGIHFYLAQRG